MNPTFPTNLNVLALHGKSQSGKSDTILKVIDLLHEEGYIIISKYSSEDTHGDICCIMEKENKLIGITTRGDDVSVLKKDFEYLGYLCDLYICCCKSKGRTIEFAGNISQNGIQVWLEKFTISHNRLSPSISIDSIQNNINLSQAKELVSIVQEVLK